MSRMAQVSLDCLRQGPEKRLRKYEDVGNNFMQYLQNSPNYSIHSHPTSQIKIEYYLKPFKTSFPGYDDVSPTVLRHAVNIISLPLAHVKRSIICLRSL